jgi:YD repeat-containing protein
MRDITLCRTDSLWSKAIKVRCKSGKQMGVGNRHVLGESRNNKKKQSNAELRCGTPQAKAMNMHARNHNSGACTLLEMNAEGYSACQASAPAQLSVYQGGALGAANLAYSYDLDGRRTGVSGSLANEILPAAVSSATYSANNQLTQWGSTAISYDLNGNTLSDGTNAYSWDARNRLVSANSNNAMFAYDPFGRRVSKTLLSTTTNFLYDCPNAVQEQNGSGVTANLLTGGVDERFQRTDSTGSYCYLTDVLGSTVAPTGSTGAE